MFRSGTDQTGVNAFDRLDDVEGVHIDAAERGAIVRKSTIADSRPGNRSKPSVEDGKFEGQGRQHRQIVLLEVVHDLLRMGDIAPLIEIAFHEPLHIRGSSWALASAEDLQIHRGQTGVRVGVELSLKVRKRLRFNRRACGVWIDRKSTRLNSSHIPLSRMPSSA